MTCGALEQDLSEVYCLIALMVGLIVGNLTAAKEPPRD
jgi:hypothetical protein